MTMMTMMMLPRKEIISIPVGMTVGGLVGRVPVVGSWS
jgi:hypothetical protein